jgi:signal peptide peptidase SppA
MLPEKAQIIAQVLLRGDGGVVDLEALGPDARRVVEGPVRAAVPYTLGKDGIATIPIIGSLVNRGAWIGAQSGLVSYEGLKTQVATAMRDDRVRAVVLDIESPGGEAVGAFECADAIKKLTQAKPVTAVVNGLMASAAYALGSAATKIVTTPTGISGSIGVVMLHADFSRNLDKAGITPTLIHAGAHKVDGNPYQPLTDDVKADLQAETETFYDLFVQCVASNRHMSAAAIRATEARTFIGQAAIDAGLADEVGTIESVVEQLRGSANPPASNRVGSSITPIPAAHGAPQKPEPRLATDELGRINCYPRASSRSEIPIRRSKIDRDRTFRRTGRFLFQDCRGRHFGNAQLGWSRSQCRPSACRC